MKANDSSSSPARAIWRVIILIVGGTVLAVGIAMIVLPGPAFVLIPLGLAILATEFIWAKKLLARGRQWIRQRRAK